MDVRIELSDVETRIIKGHRDIGKMIIAKVDRSFDPDHPDIEEFTVNELINGIKGYRLKSIQKQTDFEVSIREGCKALKGHLARHAEVGTGGPTVEEI
jgi:hypothetical protein